MYRQKNLAARCQLWPFLAPNNMNEWTREWEWRLGCWCNKTNKNLNSLQDWIESEEIAYLGIIIKPRGWKNNIRALQARSVFWSERKHKTIFYLTPPSCSLICYCEYIICLVGDGVIFRVYSAWVVPKRLLQTHVICQKNRFNWFGIGDGENRTLPLSYSLVFLCVGL